MAALSNSVMIPKRPAIFLSSGNLKSVDQSVGSINLAFSYKVIKRSSAQTRALTIQASYSDGGRSSTSSASVFIGGFVLGGLVVGALGCAFAPQITRALTGPEKKELMRKLPKFIYDEEKVMEKQRKKLAEKIEELNRTLDNMIGQPVSHEAPNGSAASSDDVEARSY